jgi:predicted nucleic acid-binding protein
MAGTLLLDTDVLVDYLRGQKDAVAYLELQTAPLVVSAITVAELYAGVREGKERRILERFLLAFEMIPVDEEISKAGGLFRRDYGQSHGVGLADALIAATAEVRKAILVTLNRRHFPMIEEVQVPYDKANPQP